MPMNVYKITYISKTSDSEWSRFLKSLGPYCIGPDRKVHRMFTTKQYYLLQFMYYIQDMEKYKYGGPSVILI